MSESSFSEVEETEAEDKSHTFSKGFVLAEMHMPGRSCLLPVTTP